MDRRTTDARAFNASAMIELAAATNDPLKRAQILAEAQPQLAWALRAAVDESQQAGHSWADIGLAIGMPRETVFRQHGAGGPIVTVKPFQTTTSPNKNLYEAPAVYAFQDPLGAWFGPHDALPDGEFETGTLLFDPANTENRFAGQALKVRYGDIDSDVSFYAMSVHDEGMSDRRIRVTHVVMDLLFGDGQSPLRRALTTVANTGEHNIDVYPRLRSLIAQASIAQARDVPTKYFVQAVEDLVEEANSTTTSGDDRLDIALRHLNRVVQDYHAWAAATAE